MVIKPARGNVDAQPVMLPINKMKPMIRIIIPMMPAMFIKKSLRVKKRIATLKYVVVTGITTGTFPSPAGEISRISA